MQMPGPTNKQRDPKQDNLRKRKKNFSALYRTVSMRLKALKNGINGKGDSKFGISPSDIKDPLPNEVVSLLSQITGQFQQLVGEADAIIDEQANYSRGRRKKQPKQPKKAPQAQPATAPQADEKVVEQLSRLGINSVSLAKYSSIDIQAQHTFKKLNKYWWQYIKSMFSQDQLNSYRMGMLSAANDLYYDLLDFENAILSQPIKNMRQVLGRYQTVRDDFAVLQKSIEKLTPPEADTENKTGNTQEPNLSQERQMKQPVGAPPPMPVVRSKDIEAIFNDVHMLFNANLAKSETVELNKLIEQFRKNNNPIMKDVIIDLYNSTMKSLIDEVQQKYGPTNDTSVQGIINLVRKNSEKSNNDIIKISHNKITRFLRKQIVKRLSFSKDAPHRLEISDQIEMMNEDIKAIIKVLETSLEPETISNYLKALEKNFEEIHKSFGILMTLYRAHFYRMEKQKKQKGKDQLPPSDDTFLDELMRRRVRRDLSKDIF